MKRFVFKVVSMSFFGALALQVVSCKEERQSSQVKTVKITFKKEGELQLKKAESDSLLSQLDIEIADDDYSTQTGLMYRKRMAANQGMLFIFPDTDYRSFYMKNTEISLDIIYIDEDLTVVSIQKNAQPFDESSLPSEGPAKYVLEVNAGLSDQWTLEKGDKIQFTKN
ncbi:DUF192 domain-containing protein [Psychroserpens sp. SPM9]|uniref:DUF192 domain-containing protein n=1 Tax=Psychroserpens sp. SPM9 TaxID=2975598 RepID=UPI0021A32985|nr:DUF192 domain-containing protein [Psychroserpens sp. SPM9]MDG5493082.1 DUF192 domain-containing protein [Psychroserpens sp. SPM9]